MPDDGIFRERIGYDEMGRPIGNQELINNEGKMMNYRDVETLGTGPADCEHNRDLLAQRNGQVVDIADQTSSLIGMQLGFAMKMLETQVAVTKMVFAPIGFAK